MAAITLNSETSTLVVNGRVINSFADGDVIELTPKAERTNRTNSSYGGVTISKKIEGDVWTMTIRLQRYSEDDRFMNAGAMADTPTVYNATLRERFTRDGNPSQELWTLENGSMTTMPTWKRQTQDGDETQEYMIEFRNVNRTT